MDQYDLLILIITRIRPRSLDKLTDSQIDTPFGNALEKIVNLIQRKVYDNYFFSLDKYEFRVRLLLHLNNMFIRINNSINIRNPQLDK
ncbi:MAG: hypothetical protein PHG99_07880, partial [Erysipelotrichaceae bacterium]|nr:hypothetical protein [Erysipelotrichaceae bacterium]